MGGHGDLHLPLVVKELCLVRENHHVVLVGHGGACLGLFCGKVLLHQLDVHVFSVQLYFHCFVIINTDLSHQRLTNILSSFKTGFW